MRISFKVIQESLRKNRSIVPEMKITDDSQITQQVIVCSLQKQKLSKIISKKLNRNNDRVPHDIKTLYGEEWYSEERMKLHADLIEDDLIPLCTPTQIEILKRNKKWFIDSSFEVIMTS